MLVTLGNRGACHAPRDAGPNNVWALTLEQRKTEWSKTPAAPKARLVDPEKLRGCDVVALKVEDIAPNGYSVERATIRQKKTGQPVRFELTEQTRQAVDEYLRTFTRKPYEFLFPSRRNPKRPLATRQYARLVDKWVASIGLDAT